ncbi:hypothetical protein KJA13_02320 [Patescibacteria group bacterium]|nr:hypothetical protein [Patescibacteria group bacterium]
MMSIFLQGLIWQFFDVPKAILKGWKNFLLFNLNYFSVPILLKTFFSHWRRYHYPYGKVFEAWKNIETFVFNMMSRIIGALLRTIFIILGLFIEALIILGGTIVFFGWLLLPVLLLAGLLFGLKLVFY